MSSLGGIAIVGGGLSGLICSYALARKNFKVYLIDSRDPRTVENSDQRAIVLSEASKIILQRIGLWDSLSRFCTPIEEVWVSEKRAFGKVKLVASEVGLDALGWAISAKDLLMVINNCVYQNANITIKANHLFKDFSEPRKILHLKSNSGSGVAIKNIEFVIGADGLNSVVRNRMGLRSEIINFEQDAIVGNISTHKDPEGIAIQRIFEEGSVALIPKKNNRLTFVFIVKRNSFKNYTRDHTKYLRQIEELCGKPFGSYSLLESPRHYPLYGLKLAYKHSEHFALVGNSRGTVHPTTAQGLNLGIRDIDELITQIQRLGVPLKIAPPVVFNKCFSSREVSELFIDSVATLYRKRNATSNFIRRAVLATAANNKRLRKIITRIGTGLDYIEQ